MTMTFDPIFAADPNNPANIAANASITIFDPADAGKAPITIADVTGAALPNPITVNKSGFGPAFTADLDRVGWFGAGFTGYLTSYEGMKLVATDAQAAAEAAQSAAETAGADAAAVASSALAGAVADAEAAATSAAASASLVGAPADTAIATAVNAPASATRGALNATYVTRASAPFTINSVDGDSNPTSITYHVTGGDVTTTYTYGVNGVATETTGASTITYTYDSSGNLTGAV